MRIEQQGRDNYGCRATVCDMESASIFAHNDCVSGSASVHIDSDSLESYTEVPC